MKFIIYIILRVMKIKTIENIPYAASFMESARSIGYSFSSAVADVIDNSIYAMASKVEINFDFGISKPFFMIFDDGRGMNRKELIEAMRYGSKSPSEEREVEDLGRFGLGLKTASLSQCRKLTVISKKDGEINALCWDLDYVIENNSWTMLEPITTDLNIIKHEAYNKLTNSSCGTIVLWEKLDRLGEGALSFEKNGIEKISLLEEHLALVFHRYISGDAKKTVISINGKLVPKRDPFLSNKTATTQLPTQKLKLMNNIVEIKPYILPYISKFTKEDFDLVGGKDDLRKNQGFYIYRNKRLIIWGDWFGRLLKKEIQKLIRVRVDIPNSMDHLWDIDIKKSKAVLPYQIRSTLSATLVEAINKGKNVFHFRGRKTNSDNIAYIWERIDNRGFISYKINREHPLVKSMLKNSSDIKLFNSLISSIENSIPYNNIYNDKADNLKFNDREAEVFKDNDLDMLRNILKNLKENLRIKFFRNEFDIEGFSVSENDRNMIKKEFDHD